MTETNHKAIASRDLGINVDIPLREIIVDAGVEVLHREGYALREEAITYANVFRFLDEEYGVLVTRGSVHERIWANQDEFRFDVLYELICSTSRREFTMLETVFKILSGLPDGLSDRERLVEAIRLSGRQLFVESVAGADSRTSFEWYSNLATRAAGGQEVLRRLNNDLTNVGLETSQIAGPDLLSVFNLQPQKALGLDADQAVLVGTVLMGAALSEFGIDYLAGLVPLGEPVTLQLGSTEPVEWTLLSVFMMAVTDMLLEPSDETGEHHVRGKLGFGSNRLAFADQPIEPTESQEVESSRRSRDVLRQLVISAAVQMTRRDGFGLMPKSITYKAAFDVVTEKYGFVVNRSSVHKRMWPSHDAFRLEVLAQATTQVLPRSSELLIAPSGQLQPAKNPDGTFNQRQLVLDNIRAGCDSDDLHKTEQKDRAWFSLKAALTSQSRCDSMEVEDLKALFASTQTEAYQRWIENFGDFLDEQGLQAKPRLGLDWDQAIHLSAILVATCSQAVDFEVFAGVEAARQTYEVPRIDGTNTTDDWSVKALGIRAIIEFIFRFAD